MKLTLKQQQSLWGYIFISPWVLGLALLFAWPLGRSLMLSFQKVTDLFQWQTEWVGLDHYRQIFTEDIVFTPVLLDTLENVAIDVPLILGLFTAPGAPADRGSGAVRPSCAPSSFCRL